MAPVPRTTSTPISRRAVMAGLLGVGAGVGLTTQVGGPAWAGNGQAKGRFDVPLTEFTGYKRLKDGKPNQVQLDAPPLERGWDEVVSYTEPAEGVGHPLYVGGALLYGHQGRVVLRRGAGQSVKYADADTLLPEAEWIDTRTDTIYDMASMSKLFTSIVVIQQVEEGRIDLDQKVAHYLPVFATNGKESITVRMLLTHTSGFTSWIPLYSSYPDIPSRIHAVLTQPLLNPPGSTYLYSDLNLITLAAIAEHVSGQQLDELVAEGITDPLGMVDTGYNPPESKLQRIAATEYQEVPDRGMVWGEVHDENAWSLGGVAGHAGIFSTLDDMAILAQTMLNGGWYGEQRILSEESVTAIISNENEEFPGDAHGLGFELNQRWYMSGLTSIRTAGHTGYTGTSLVIDFNSASFVILLTNRVHPSREWGSINPARRSAADGMADALRIKPYAGGRSYWQASEAPNSTSTLDLAVPANARELRFGLFLDIEASDPFALEVSTDGGTTWQFLAYTLDGEQITEPIGRSGLRQWQPASAQLPGGLSVQVRWRHDVDTDYTGRGLLVDGIQVRDERRVVLDAEHHPAGLIASGWTLVTV